MIESIILVLVGAFIGWHFPQPDWAKTLEAKIKGLFNK
jgi:hypothetical protein